jgi:hypothetical protein
MSDPPTALDPDAAPTPAPDPALDAGVAAFAEISARGASILAAVTLPDGTPRATRAWSCEVVDATRRRLRIVFSDNATELVDALRTGTGRVAVTSADVATLESVQVKGPVVSVGPTTPHDDAVVAHHCELLIEVIHRTDGMPVDVLRRFLPVTTIAVELEVEEVYDQTPGPTAGARHTPGAAP